MSKVVLAPDLEFGYDSIVFDTSCSKQGAEVRFYKGRNLIATMYIDRFDKGDSLTVEGVSGELSVQVHNC